MCRKACCVSEGTDDAEIGVKDCWETETKKGRRGERDRRFWNTWRERDEHLSCC